MDDITEKPEKCPDCDGKGYVCVEPLDAHECADETPEFVDCDRCATRGVLYKESITNG